VTSFPETPEFMAGLVHELILSGANIIGGCCGTTPDHIKQMATAVKS
jgi:methionine synthase I (cobalamin-dependent)